MDRIRAGLTGLGFVFLITAAASLLLVPSQSGVAGVEQKKEPGEPLSQLGVAPNTEKESAANADPSVVPKSRPPIADSPVNADRSSPGMIPLNDEPVAI